MKIDDDVARKTPITTGSAKLCTALPPLIAIGNMASTVVIDVNMHRIRT